MSVSLIIIVCSSAILITLLLKMSEKPKFLNLFAPLYDLYLSHANCDLALISADGVKFNVHSIAVVTVFPKLRQEEQKFSVINFSTHQFVQYREELLFKKPTGFLACIGFKKQRKRSSCILSNVNARELRLLIKYSYLGKCDFFDLESDNLVELLRATVCLDVPDLTSQIEAHLENNLCIATALKLYPLKDESGLEHAFRLAEEFLLRHFLPEISLENQDVDLKTLTALLKNDHLHVRYEEQVWEAIREWVEKDDDARKVHLDQLVKCLRVGLVSEPFLQENVMSSDLIESSPKAKIHIQLAQKAVQEWSESSNEEDEPPYEARQRIPHQTLVVVGGFEAENPENAAPVSHLEFYNINSNCWTVKENWSLPQPRGYFSVENIDDYLYVIGGVTADETLKSCHKLNLLTGQWTEAPPMTRKRCYVATAVLGGEIYIVGGQGARPHEWLRPPGEKFNPVENCWRQLPEMTSHRCDAAAVNLDGVLYALGGFDGHIVLYSVEKFEPKTRTWTFGPRMVRPRSGLAAVVLNGHILAFGGYDGNVWLADGERFEPSTQTWSLLAAMVVPRSNFGLVTNDGLVYAVGGFAAKDGLPLNDAEVYHPASNLWHSLEGVGIPRAGLAAFVVDSLSFALKIWGLDKKTHGPIARKVPPYQSVDREYDIEEETLEVPSFGELPAAWLAKYKHDQEYPPTQQANINPLFALQFGNP